VLEHARDFTSCEIVASPHFLVVNPARVKAFAQSRMLRTKTDSADAALIAQFCKTQSPAPWSAPTPEVRRLQALVRHLEHLKNLRAQQLTYAQMPDAPALVTESIQSVIANLDAEIAQIERAIGEHFDNHPGLRGKRDLLTSIPGIGEATAATILAEIPGFDQFSSSKAIAAYAGLSPRDRRSGTSIHGRPRMCKTGNPRVRKSLYFPALVAIRHNPLLMLASR
jgi:transposase